MAAGGDVALAAQTAGREFGLEQVPEPIRPQIVIPNHRDLELPGIDIHRVVPARWSVEWRRGLFIATCCATSYSTLCDVAR